MLKTIITTTLLVAGVAQANPRNSCPSRNVPVPVFVDVAWERMAQFQQKYSDFYYRCGSMIGQLKRAEGQARMHLNYGSIGAAATVLINTLVQAGQQLPPEDAEVAYPLTMESIRQGAKVAQKLLNATASDKSMTTKMSNQVKYAVVRKIYQAINKAYTELDTPYYEQVNRRCYRGCVSLGLPDLFSGYYHGVSELAKEFLDIQNETGRAQGTDKVELNMIAASANAAKKIILNSAVRRDYSCAILELHAIQVEAETFLCEGNPGFNQYHFVRSLGERLASVNFPQRGCGWGRGNKGYPNRGGRGHHPDYSYNQSSDVEVDVDVNVNVEVEVED